MATAAEQRGVRTFLLKNTDTLIAVGVVSVIILMIIPIPTVLMDILLASMIMYALSILFVALYVLQPLDFSVFPSVLLIATLFRLALNIASTRLILLHGHEGTDAAGKIIESFGQFVVGGDYIVGIIVFLILVIINFVVITKGAGRVAEVAARFTLDALPGKQMAIDADLNTGLINEEEAKRRRAELRRESDFYGAMDGASKFVRGDAVAGMIITGINIIGGLFIGIVMRGMAVRDAAETYTILTVGDGLVTQIPALIISSSAGIIVTRAAAEHNLSMEFLGQLTRNHRAMALVAAILVFFAFLPGMPTVAFLVLAAIAGSIAYMVRRVGIEKQREQKMKEQKEKVTESERIESLLPIDIMELEVGYGLIPLVDSAQGGELLNRITSLRRQFASQLGIVIPPIHIRDNLQLQSNEYRILIKGIEVGRGQLMMERYLAMNPGDIKEELPGIPTKEPAFGLPAIWITADTKKRAEAIGYTVVDCPTIVATHISEVIKSNAHELLGRQEVFDLIEIFKRQNPKIVEELIPNILPLGEVHKVLKNLLKERLSIRDLRTILEALADNAVVTKDTDVLTELVRQRMSKYITSQFKTPDGKIHVLHLDKESEDTIRASLQKIDEKFQVAIDPSMAQRLIDSLEEGLRKFALTNYQPLLVVSADLRRPMRDFLERFLPQLSIVSYREIEPGVRIESMGVVSLHRKLEERTVEQPIRTGVPLNQQIPTR